MALSDKNILITPNIGSSSDPKITFSGADSSTGAQNITLNVYPTNNGTLSFEGSNGQLFSIGNTMSGTIFSVNDISGIPSIEVLDTGLVKIAQYNGDTNIGGILGSSGTRLTVKGYANTWDSTTPGYGKGTLHFDIYGSTGSYDGAAITFSAKDTTNPAQAGIYVTSSGSFGTRMYLATTDSYATGSRTAIGINESGVVNFPRARPTYAGNTILDAGNYTSYSPSLTGSGASGTWGINITGSAGSAGSITGITTAQLVRGNSSSAWGARTTNLSGNSLQGLSSGFYDGSSMTNMPTTDWYHMFVNAHSNSYSGNQYEFHIATAFWNYTDFWMRSVSPSATGSWRKLLHDGNYTGYAPSTGGTGATGTWGISISGNAATATRAAGNFYIDSNYGRGIVGVYSSYRYQGVFAMGDSYKLADDGTSTGSLYGMAWSHPNTGGIAGNLSSHGLILMQNGGFMCALSTNIVASGNIVAQSDERLKTNWRDLPTDYVTKLAGVKVGIYDRIDQTEVTQVGVSAQSLQAILPEAVVVAKDEEQTLSVNYGAAALASSIELAKEVVDLRARVASLEALISKLIKE